MSNQPSITYLLGAGASAQTMPLVNRFSQYFTEPLLEIREWAPKIYPGLSWLKNDDTVSKERLANAFLDTLRTIPGDNSLTYNYFNLLQRYLAICKQHFSIDTYAKKLWFQSADDRLLKQVLSSVLLYRQLKHGIDKRYEAFLASILTKQVPSTRVQFPNNLQIFSWNYDFQIEEAIWNINESLYNRLFANYPDSSNQAYWALENGFFFTKLNGSCSSYWKGSAKFDIKEFQETRLTFNSENYLQFLDHFKHLKHASTNGIRFAWEHNPTEQQLRFSHISNATHLVVIGYSFPNFNSEVDSKILASGNIKKIYIQCGASNKAVKERIAALAAGPLVKRQFRYELIDGVDEFYIPRDVAFTYGNMSSSLSGSSGISATIVS